MATDPHICPRIARCRLIPHRGWVLLVLLAIASGLPPLGSAPPPTGPAPAPAGDHECHLFGYVYGPGGGDADTLAHLCNGLWEETLLARGGEDPSTGGRRASPSRDGWGFAYFLAPAHPGLARPIPIRSGAAASDDTLRWIAAQAEISAFALGGASCVLGHVRKSSYGPDEGALPDPHPFADSLGGRWWLFAHNGHLVPDTALAWTPEEFLARHPLDYLPLMVDSEIFFRYCAYEIEQHGAVRAGLLTALHRLRAHYSDFVYNITMTDGDTLWAAHSHNLTDFYYMPAPDSLSWWASTVKPGEQATQMAQHHLYWFTAGGMGEASYD